MYVRDSGTAKFYSKNKRFANGTVFVKEALYDHSRTTDHRHSSRESATLMPVRLSGESRMKGYKIVNGKFSTTV